MEPLENSIVQELKQHSLTRSEHAIENVQCMFKSLMAVPKATGTGDGSEMGPYILLKVLKHFKEM